MFDSKLYKYSETLANFILNMRINSIPINSNLPYYHMGGTITDSILQAGLNYHHVVYPRIKKLISKFQDYKKTSDFIILMDAFPLSKLIDWNNAIKLNRIIDLSWLLYENGVESEDQLAVWLNKNNNIVQLQKLNGIGPKTIDYLKKLSGIQAIAIDRHLVSFLKLSGVPYPSYEDANLIYSQTASILGISQQDLDSKVWLYMSKNSASNL